MPTAIALGQAPVYSYVVTCACSVVSNSLHPMDCNPPGFTVHGIFQARILEQVAISYSRDLPDPGIEPVTLSLAGRFFTAVPPGKPKGYLTI